MHCARDVRVLPPKRLCTLLLSTYRVQAENIDLDNILLHGGNAEDNDAAAAVIKNMQRGRVMAARARRDYDRAVRSLQKVGGMDTYRLLGNLTEWCSSTGASTFRLTNFLLSVMLVFTIVGIVRAYMSCVVRQNRHINIIS